MTELESNKNNEKFSFLVFVFFCITITVGLILIHFIEDKDKELVGIDGYGHLVRVADLYETGKWYHPSPMKTNTPYGDISHWTRPFDVVLLLGAVPLSKWMGFEQALFAWGVAISPVLLALTLIALFWAVKILLSKDAPFFIVFVVGVQFGFAECFQPARPDHHSLLALFFVLMVGFALRLVVWPFSRPLCWLAGLTAAIAVWASIESIVIVSLTVSVLGLFWVFQGKNFFKKCLHFSVALFIFSCISLLLERPLSDIKAIEYDRLSIVYCGLFGLMELFWMVAVWVDSRTNLLHFRMGRLVYSLLGCSVTALVMWFLFPKFFKGPLVDIDPRIIPIWFDHIIELQPLYSGIGPLTPLVQTLGSLLVSIAFVVYVLFKVKDEANRRGWIMLTTLTAIFSFLAFRQIRWLVYPQILLSIVMTELLYRMLARLKDRGPVVLRALIKSGIIVAFSSFFLCLGLSLDYISKGVTPMSKNRTISLIPLYEHLNEMAEIEQKDFRIFTHNRFSAEIVYHTNFEVLGTYCHRGEQAILNNYMVMMAENNQKAFEILHKRRIDFVLLCPRRVESIVREQSEVSSTFAERLCEDQVPPWLHRVTLPDSLSEDFLLFETVFADSMLVGE